MRVGVYFADFAPQSGGAFAFVANILGEICEVAGSSDHEFVLLCEPKAAEFVRDKPKAHNVVVVRLSPRSRLSLRLSNIRYLPPIVRLFLTRPGPIARAAREHGVQLLWFVGTGVQESPDIPYLATVWDLQHRVQPFFPEVSSAGLWDKRELFNRYFIGRAAFCITGTEAGKREIERFYGLTPGRGKVIPFPTPLIHLADGPSNIRVRERFGCDRRFVLYPGQFWPHKNHANLILALKWLRETRGLDLALVLPGGDKGNLSFIKEFCGQNGMEERVYFPGFVSTEELVALYREAELLAFVTYFGPDNIPPLEAFALGCPVVCSDVDGAAEQYGEAAIRVNPSRPHEIGRAIECVINDKELREELIAAGFERAKASTPQTYIREVFRLIDEFADVRRNWP